MGEFTILDLRLPEFEGFQIGAANGILPGLRPGSTADGPAAQEWAHLNFLQIPTAPPLPGEAAGFHSRPSSLQIRDRTNILRIFRFRKASIGRLIRYSCSLASIRGSDRLRLLGLQ
jgi:hypothetical protein